MERVQNLMFTLTGQHPSTTDELLRNNLFISCLFAYLQWAGNS